MPNKYFFAVKALFKNAIQDLSRMHMTFAAAVIALVFFALLLPSGEVQANRRAMPMISADIDLNPQRAFTGLATTTLSEPTLDVGSGTSTDDPRLKSAHYHRDDNSVGAEKISHEPEVHQQLASGSITSTFHKSGLAAGLSNAMILQLAEIFGSEIDLMLDLHRSDQFTVLYDEYYVDGKKIGNGPILAASFTSQGKTHSAFRYVYANGEVGYFSAEGVNMHKTFMRAPLAFMSVMSPFSASRLHPLFNTSRPHRGIDYAAPTGTPVYAAGDGRVMESTFNDSMGNYVVIQHDGTYSTKYLHMNKRSVKVGDRVKQHQVIGAVGSTGWATGPHLHYEFLVNGVHTNPAKIADKLPKANRIAWAEQRRFGEQVRNLMAQLAANSTPNKLARQDSQAAQNL